MTDVVVVHTIPQSSVVSLPGVPAGERAQVRAELEAAVGHDRFYLHFPAEGAAPASLLAPEDLIAVLRATMTDAVRAEVRDEARRVAAETASEALAAHAS